MKIIGKEEQKKIDLQIKSLEKKAADLESKLAEAKSKHKDLDSTAKEFKAKVAELQAAFDTAQKKSEQAEKELARKSKEFEAQLTQQTVDSQVKLSEVSEKYQALELLVTEQNVKIAELKGSLDSAQKQSDRITQELDQANQENELLLSQLMQVQEELERIFLDKKDREEEVQRLNKEVDSVKAELEKISQELDQVRQQLDSEQKSKQAIEYALGELKAKSPAQLKAVTEKYQQQSQLAQSLETELAAARVELEKALESLKQAKTEAAQALQNKLESEVLQVNALTELERLKNELSQLDAQHISQIKDAQQENELLLSQLMQVQEELESHYLDKIKYESLYKGIQSRWERLEKRYPNYVDFGSVELVKFDNLSDIPSVTWRVKDFAQGGVAYEQFMFQMILQDGHPGIRLVADENSLEKQSSALVPNLLKPNSQELLNFMRMSQSDFRQILSAVTIFNQLESTAWRGVEIPQGFDVGFWRGSLKLLPQQLQALPVVLRYDSVKLKRELVNPDYEHLWLEFKGLGLGGRTWPKFEMRLGAALIQRNGFSEFPKFEFPLIDGKTKPFDSWFAESQDDSGAKLELRFSLEKQVFDTKVWEKLEAVDKAFLLRLIYSVPDVLKRLEEQQTPIHRPWTTWIKFAKASVDVIETIRAEAKTKEVSKPEPKKPPEKTNAVQIAVPVKKIESIPKLTKKSIPQKPSAKKAPVKKSAVKVTLANKVVAKKVVTTKAVAKKVSAKKVSPKNALAKKVADQKVLVKKSVAKKSLAKNIDPKKASPATKVKSNKTSSIVSKNIAAKKTSLGRTLKKRSTSNK